MKSCRLLAMSVNQVEVLTLHPGILEREVLIKNNRGMQMERERQKQSNAFGDVKMNYS